MRRRAAVVGLGAIGMGYDFSRAPKDARVVATHAQAFSVHPSFELAAGIDPDPAKRAAFTRKFRRPAFASLSAFFRRGAAEVFAVAAPVNAHAALVREALRASPAAVVCEKPFTADAGEASRLERAAKKAGALLLVNFIRRFEPGTKALRDRVVRGGFGEFRGGTAFYTKGLWNNASHVVDLACFLLGRGRAKAVLRRGRTRADGDPEPDFLLEFGGRPLYVMAAREEDYELVELTLNFSRAQVRYGAGGSQVRWTPSRSSKTPGESRTLDPEPRRIMTDFSRYQWHVVDALAGALKRRTLAMESTSGAVRTLDLLETVSVMRARAGGR